MKTIKELKALASNRIITHAGIFHADDVLCAALLDIFEVVEYDHLDVIKRVFKVPDNFQGLVFDIGGGEFDHHQSDARVRENGVKFAAFGLLWDQFGMDWLLKSNVQEVSELAWDEFDKNFVQSMDLTDNFGQDRYPNTLSYLISARAATNPNHLDEEFYQTVVDTIPFLNSAINRAIQNAQKIVKARKLAEEQRAVVVLDEYIPAICFKGTPAKYIVAKSNREGYNVTCVPGNIIPYAADEMTGCIFVHPAKFLAVFDSKEHAVQYANAMAMVPWASK